MDRDRMTDLTPTRRRSSRFWLYAPFVLLAALALGWSGFWFYVRERVTEAIDTALAHEIQRGRTWTCRDRTIGGFPFRVEIRCGSLALTSTRWGEAVRVETGPSLAVGQIYSPGLVIVQIASPLRATLTQGRSLDLTWTRLEASLAHLSPERLALVVSEPGVSLATPGMPTQLWRAAAFEAYLRRNPTRPSAEQVVDIALAAKGTVLPEIDALLGTSEPGDIELQASLTQAEAFRLGFNPDALETWRSAGGQIELTRLLSTKGPARIEASGQLLLDQTHRPAGQLQVGVAGIDQIGSVRLGGLSAGLGGLLGGRVNGSAPGTTPGLTQLPSLVLREGRAYLGPFRLPLQPLAPLY
jgi:hypothetical protein